jgi:hypothetical protein
MIESKPKLKVESDIDIFSFYFGYVFFIGLFAYFISIFHENSIISSIFLLIILFFLFSLRYNQIKVYSDKIEIINKGLFKFNTSVKIFYFDQIIAIDACLRIGGTKGALIQLIGVFRASVNLVSWNEYSIIFQDDKKKSFNTQIEREELLKVFDLIKRFSGNRIKVTVAQPNLLD